MLLTGSIFVTSNEDIILNLDCVNTLTRIISLDEDDILPESPVIIGGTCLLPPPTAKIAEADGNEALYDQIYAEHLLAPFQQEYMAALLSFLMIGGKLVIFFPQVGVDNTFDKLFNFILRLYGIHVGVLDSTQERVKACWYDNNHYTQWMDLIYLYTGQINPYQYLIGYPYNSPIDNRIMMRLLADLRPYGTSINEQIEVIKSLRKQLQINPNITLPVESLR